jgi:hypothetical protein
LEGVVGVGQCLDGIVYWKETGAAEEMHINELLGVVGGNAISESQGHRKFELRFGRNFLWEGEGELVEIVLRDTLSKKIVLGFSDGGEIGEEFEVPVAF